MTEEKRDGAAGPNRVAIGCLLAVPGFFGGGMVGAFVSKLVSGATGVPPPEGLPGVQPGLVRLAGGVDRSRAVAVDRALAVAAGNGGSGNSARS